MNVNGIVYPKNETFLLIYSISGHKICRCFFLFFSRTANNRDSQSVSLFADLFFLQSNVPILKLFIFSLRKRHKMGGSRDPSTAMQA